MADLNSLQFAAGECREFELNSAAAFRWLVKKPYAPSTSVERDILYIDAQHGLGNRLRAIASGASIAKKIGRELVELSFLEDARTQGLKTLNYMEMNEGSTPGAPLVVEAGVSAYARSTDVWTIHAVNGERRTTFCAV